MVSPLSLWGGLIILLLFAVALLSLGMYGIGKNGFKWKVNSDNILTVVGGTSILVVSGGIIFFGYTHV